MPSRSGAPAPMFSQGLPTPQPLPIRPLLGLDLLNSTLMMKDGSWLDAKNVMVRPKGLYRIPGYSAFAPGNTWSPAGNPTNLVGVWSSDGIQRPYLLTEQNIFLADQTSGYTDKPWTYTTGTIDTSGTAVTPHSGSTPLWATLGVKAGDTMKIGSTTYVISVVTSDSSITLATSAGTQSGVAYTITRFLYTTNPYMPDVTVAHDLTLPPYLAIAGFGNQIAMLNPTTGVVSNLTGTAAKQPASGGINAEAITYFVGRIFAGHLIDGSNGENRTLIRWSKATDTTDFSDPTAFYDLSVQSDQVAGAVRRFLMMSGSMLMVYMDDAIYAGTPSNTPNLPVSFQQIPSGRVGICGPKAVASVVLPRNEQNLWGINVTGHFFVGWDNIYFLSSSNLSLEPIGDKVAINSIQACQNPWRVQASVDWAHQRVRFGFPRSQNYIENIYDYHWQTKEWSYEQRQTWLLAAPFLNLPLTISYFSAIAFDDAYWSTVTFASILNVPTTRATYIENAGGLWSLVSDTLGTNPDGTANPIRLETKDYDEGAPGMVKLWRMLRIKIDWEPGFEPTLTVALQVQISTDRGRTYRSAGTMNIANGNDEGMVNFRATGPHIRFLITSSGVATPYYITELTKLVSLRGVQQSTIQQTALP